MNVFKISILFFYLGICAAIGPAKKKKVNAAERSTACTTITSTSTSIVSTSSQNQTRLTVTSSSSTISSMATPADISIISPNLRSLRQWQALPRESLILYSQSTNWPASGSNIDLAQGLFDHFNDAPPPNNNPHSINNSSLQHQQQQQQQAITLALSLPASVASTPLYHRPAGTTYPLENTPKKCHR